MASLIHLDTHVVVWLYLGDRERLSAAAADLLAGQATIAIAPMVELELTFLNEIDRLSNPGSAIAETLGKEIGLTVDRSDPSEVVREAERQSWTRDPFDRIIAAQSICADATLITADRRILDELPNARW